MCVLAAALLHAIAVALEHMLLHVRGYLLALRLGEAAGAQQLLELRGELLQVAHGSAGYG